jgi:pSer/pThr/pTyr-binding forkhead associated (FHA) protein
MTASVTLEVTHGPLTGATFFLPNNSKWVVGRDANCSVQLPAGGFNQTASRKHCCIKVDRPTVVVRDLGSLNGTYVNGVCIGRRHVPGDETEMEPILTEVVLHDGDFLEVGMTRFRVRIPEDWELEADVPVNYEAPPEEGCTYLGVEEHCLEVCGSAH